MFPYGECTCIHALSKQCTKGGTLFMKHQLYGQTFNWCSHCARIVHNIPFYSVLKSGFDRHLETRRSSEGEVYDKQLLAQFTSGRLQVCAIKVEV